MLISLDIGLKVGGILGLVVAVPIAGFIKGTFDALRTPPADDNLPLITTGVVGGSEASEQPNMTPTK